MVELSKCPYGLELGDLNPIPLFSLAHYGNRIKENTNCDIFSPKALPRIIFLTCYNTATFMSLGIGVLVGLEKLLN